MQILLWKQERMALLKDNGTHTFLLMIGSKSTKSMIPRGTHISHWSMCEWCSLKLGTQPVWPTVAAHRGAYMIHPGALTQPGRYISALTCGIHHQPSHTPFPAKLSQYSLILTYHFISVQIYSVPSWLPTGPLLQAKTHPSGSFVSVILLTFSKRFAALTIMCIVIVK